MPSTLIANASVSNWTLSLVWRLGLGLQEESSGGVFRRSLLEESSPGLGCAGLLPLSCGQKASISISTSTLFPPGWEIQRVGKSGPQITPKYGAISFATQRIDCRCHRCCFQFVAFRFIYHLSLKIEIAFASRLGLFFFFGFLLFCFCLSFISIRFISLFFVFVFCWPGNHCQQLMNSHWWAWQSFNEQTTKGAVVLFPPALVFCIFSSRYIL